MSEVRTILASHRQKRRMDDTQLVCVTGEQMQAEVEFTYETMMTGGQGKTKGAVVRSMFLRRPDHLEEHTLQIEDHLRRRFALPKTQAHLIWAANQTARGDLHAALAGLSADDLDDAPPQPAGEWSLRQILEHIIVVDRYYTLDVQHAIGRFHAGEPHGDLPDDELQFERRGASLSELVSELDLAREEALRATLGLTNEEIRAPARWGVHVDVRFLLMRFAHHDREHTDQVRKWRIQCGKPCGETERLLGLCWQASGALEGSLIGVLDDVLDRDPGDGEWPVRRILKHIRSSEAYFKRMIEQAK